MLPRCILNVRARLQIVLFGIFVITKRRGVLSAAYPDDTPFSAALLQRRLLIMFGPDVRLSGLFELQTVLDDGVVTSGVVKVVLYD